MNGVHEHQYFRIPSGAFLCTCDPSYRPPREPEEGEETMTATYDRDTPLSPGEAAVVAVFGLDKPEGQDLLTEGTKE